MHIVLSDTDYYVIGLCSNTLTCVISTDRQCCWNRRGFCQCNAVLCYAGWRWHVHDTCNATTGGVAQPSAVQLAH